MQDVPSARLVIKKVTPRVQNKNEQLSDMVEQFPVGVPVHVNLFCVILYHIDRGTMCRCDGVTMFHSDSVRVCHSDSVPQL